MKKYITIVFLLLVTITISIYFLSNKNLPITKDNCRVIIIDAHYRKNGTYIKSFQRKICTKPHGVKRSEAVKSEFKRMFPCPITNLPEGPCPGWEIHHVIPLYKGGPDTVDNMMWLTDEDHKLVHSHR